MTKTLLLVPLLLSLAACVAKPNTSSSEGNSNSSEAIASSSEMMSSSSEMMSSSSAMMSSSSEMMSSSAPASSSSSSAPVLSAPDAYTTLSCNSCHGANGEGFTGLGPELLHPVVDYATWVIRNGRSGGGIAMPAFNEGTLSNNDLTAIMEWLSAAPQPTTGEGLYMDYCSACHGNNGIGSTNHNATNASLNELMGDVRNGHHGTEFSNRTGYMPKWSSDKLSNAEIELIFNYLQTL